MIKAQSVIGKTVLSRADGEKLDSVKDVIIGTDHTRVIALLITEGGLFSKPIVVPMENVVSFGKDAVMITDSKAAQRADHVPAVAQALDMDEKLGGKKVFSETGDQHGKLADIYFDEKTGDLAGVDVTDLGPGSSSKSTAFLDMSDIISFGADAVVITSGAVAKLTSPSSQPDQASSTPSLDGAGSDHPLEPLAAGPAPTEDEAPAAARLAADTTGLPHSTGADASVPGANAGATGASITTDNHSEDARSGGSGTAGG